MTSKAVEIVVVVLLRAAVVDGIVAASVLASVAGVVALTAFSRAVDLAVAGGGG